MHVKLDIADNAAKEIETLKKECGFETDKDFIDGAITLLKWAVKQARDGNAVASVDEREANYVELQMDFLEHVRPHPEVKVNQHEALHQQNTRKAGA